MTPEAVGLITRVDHDFTLHPPMSDAIAQQMDEVRLLYKELATTMATVLPAGRDQDLCITHLEDSLMRAIASIARNQPHRDAEQ